MYDISDKSEAIREIQRYLLELYYDEGTPTPVVISGVYDDATRAAVTAYQAGRGLPATGEVDRTTFEMLYKDYSTARDRRLSPTLIPPDTPLPVTIGARGEGVASLQRLMNFLGERYGISERTEENGIYTYEASLVANALQAIYRLPKSDEVSGEFYAKMLRDLGYPPLPAPA